MTRSRLLTTAILILTLLSFLPKPVQAEPLDYDIANGHFYTQANGQPPGASAQGYSLTNDGGIPMWDEFQRLGGVGELGFPSSRRFVLDGFVVQATQKVIMQWRPDAGQVYFLNTLDVMHDAGKDAWLGAVRATPGVLPPSFDEGKDWEAVKAARWALLDDNEALKAAYWAVSDPLNLNGLPVSPVQDRGDLYVIRTQRKVFQQWKVNVPWASAGQVTVANGGDLYKEAGLLPSNAGTPEDPGGAQASPAPAPAPVASAPSSGASYPGVGYGFQIDPGNDPARALDMTKAAGFSWIKAQIRWESTEPQKGNIQWGNMDNIANLAAARGIKVLFSVVTAPDWSRPGANHSYSGPPDNPQDFANFVGAIASRLKGKVHAYEVWNEQNRAEEAGGPGKQNATAYVALLKAAYTAIKAADPNAVVLSGAPTPAGTVDLGQGALAIDDIDYFRQMYAAGAKPYFDAVAAHPSGFNNAPDTYENSGARADFKGHRSFYYRNYENYRQVMVDNGDGAKQIWFTEFGWAVAQGTAPPKDRYFYATQNTEQQQAEWLVRTFQIAKASGYVGPMFVWNLNFANSGDAADSEALRAFSVLRPDWTGRPSYNALAAMPK
ncbi:MAG: cellulase family glycosylhydrolase [Dehalococcoidia bacterium]|nr:cellulase family glycosylhydrolase [Dehalococcoidia bacterium]